VEHTTRSATEEKEKMTGRRSLGSASSGNTSGSVDDVCEEKVGAAVPPKAVSVLNIVAGCNDDVESSA
jgi:hypothetical protein